MRRRTLVDTRNIIAHAEWREAGFRVQLLGSGKGEPESAPVAS
jgi:hypothetical protein